MSFDGFSLTPIRQCETCLLAWRVQHIFFIEILIAICYSQLQHPIPHQKKTILR